jgi:hypothetical protein
MSPYSLRVPLFFLRLCKCTLYHVSERVRLQDLNNGDVVPESSYRTTVPTQHSSSIHGKATAKSCFLAALYIHVDVIFLTSCNTSFCDMLKEEVYLHRYFKKNTLKSKQYKGLKVKIYFI